MLERKNTDFSLRGPSFVLYVVHEKFIEVLLFQETSPATKNPWLRAWKVILHWEQAYISGFLWNNHFTITRPAVIPNI